MSLGRALTSDEVAHLLWPLELQEGWPRREYVPHLPFRQDQNRGRNVSAGDQADAPAQQGDRLGLQLACGGGEGYTASAGLDSARRVHSEGRSSRVCPDRKLHFDFIGLPYEMTLRGMRGPGESPVWEGSKLDSAGRGDPCPPTRQVQRTGALATGKWSIRTRHRAQGTGLSSQLVLTSCPLEWCSLLGS